MQYNVYIKDFLCPPWWPLSQFSGFVNDVIALPTLTAIKVNSSSMSLIFSALSLNLCSNCSRLPCDIYSITIESGGPELTPYILMTFWWSKLERIAICARRWFIDVSVSFAVLMTTSLDFLASIDAQVPVLRRTKRAVKSKAPVLLCSPKWTVYKKQKTLISFEVFFNIRFVERFNLKLII